MVPAKLLAVPAFLSVLLTVIATPIVIAVYRKRISFWMRARSGLGAVADSPSDTSTAESPGALRPLAWSFLDLGAAAAYPRDPLVLAAHSGMQRVAVAYAAGGLTHALLLNGVFWLAHQDVASTGDLIAAFIVFTLPALVTVLYLLTASGTIWLFTIAGVLLAAYIALGDLRGSLVLLIFAGQLLVPALLFALFNLRFWRGVAPLLLVVLAFATFSWVLCAELLRASFDGVPLAVWVGRIGGFLVGGWIGYWALRGLRRLNDARWLSDQELFLDTWWFLHTIVQTVIYVLTLGPQFFLVLLLFPVYFLVKRTGFRVLGVRESRRSPLRLLLLRVFGYDARAERLFDYLDRQWRFVGRIELIAGRDLAARNIGPLEFADFLAARLRRRFVTSLSDLRTRLAALDDQVYPDGRFRAEHFYCQDDTWRPAMRALAADCDMVLMDLRGFGRSNAGARYELLHLARTAPDKPVVLLADEQTELGALDHLIGAHELPRGSGERPAPWQVVQIGRGSKLSGARLMALLAGALDRGRGDYRKRNRAQA